MDRCFVTQAIQPKTSDRNRSIATSNEPEARYGVEGDRLRQSSVMTTLPLAALLGVLARMTARDVSVAGGQAWRPRQA